MRSLKQFLVNDAGFIAAEKALITLLALAAIIVVAKIILSGSQTASNTVKTKLEQSK